MNYEELRRYIRDLQQSGFDVVRLRVQLNKKLSFPLITLIMAVLAVPFSISAAKEGRHHRSRGRRSALRSSTRGNRGCSRRWVTSASCRRRWRPGRRI
jgi:hypothetical protein